MTDGERGDGGEEERKDGSPDSYTIQLLITEGAWRLYVTERGGVYVGGGQD